MSLSDDDPLSPPEKNQEPEENPQDSSFLSSKETEKKTQTSMSHETQAMSFVPPMNRDEEVSTSEYATSLGNLLLNSSGGMLGTEMQPTFGDVNDQSYLSLEDSNVTGGFPAALKMPSQMEQEKLDDDFDLSTLFTDPTKDLQLGFDDDLKKRSGIHGERHDDTNDTFDPFGYQSNFSRNPLKSIESMMKGKRDIPKMKMVSTPGLVNSSTDNNSNNEESYLNDEASHLSTSNGLLQKPESQKGIGVRPGMQQTVTNVSNSDANDTESVDLCTSFTTSTTISQACDNLERSGIQGEGYGTNNPDFFGDTSNFLLGSGENIASMSSQRDDYRPEKQKKMSNVSNSSQSDGVGMYAKRIDSGNIASMSSERDKNQNAMVFNNRNDDQSYLSVEATSASFKPVSSTSSTLQQPQWTITKTLSRTDVDKSNSRLLLFKIFVVDHIMKHLPEADQKEIHSKEGLKIDVYDHDKKTTHPMILAYHKIYNLRGSWTPDFLVRRDLREGDEIGLFWDSSQSMLHFSVLDHATPAEEKKIVKPVISNQKKGKGT